MNLISSLILPFLIFITILLTLFINVFIESPKEFLIVSLSFITIFYLFLIISHAYGKRMIDMIFILLQIFSLMAIYTSCLYLAFTKYSFDNLSKIENTSELINSLILFYYITGCFSFIFSLFSYFKEKKVVSSSNNKEI